ncbi:hypothetical protein Q9251_18040 [Alkalihalobacillus macyae]|uniref:hypothetical protein n=1 Tax=Guptibacillus hwajinpoensis TaxID=208199 RepID=UPI00273C9A26|nr:hypothetical protein [Alkalihalobacillus macyae]MDP4552786.1 hypothetical protein [Alkalihalobacillus macyae]
MNIIQQNKDAEYVRFALWWLVSTVTLKKLPGIEMKKMAVKESLKSNRHIM